MCENRQKLKFSKCSHGQKGHDHLGIMPGKNHWAMVNFRIDPSYEQNKTMHRPIYAGGGVQIVLMNYKGKDMSPNNSRYLIHSRGMLFKLNNCFIFKTLTLQHNL